MTLPSADEPAAHPQDAPAPDATLGQLALRYVGKRLPLQVLCSAHGYYIGTGDHEGPVSRESVEYYGSQQAAQDALDTGNWTQRLFP